MNYFGRYAALFCGALLAAVPLCAQQEEDKNIEDAIEKLARDAAIAYTKPIVSGLGSDLNGGWYRRAPRATMFGFDLEFGLVGMFTVFTDEQKRFTTDGTFQFDSSQAAFLTDFIKTDPAFSPYNASQRQALQATVIQQIRGVDFGLGMSGPTAAGSKKDSINIHWFQRTITVTDPNTGLSRNVTVPNRDVPLPVTGLFEGNESFFPFAVPQVTFGTIVGTQFTFRFIPEIDLKEYGKVKYFGFGIQHNPMIWFGDPLPFNTSVAFFTQKLKLGNNIEASASSFGVNASMQLGWGLLNLTPYAGYMVESSKMNFSYAYTVDLASGPREETIAFELKGENKSRFTAGINLKVLIINVNADINLGKYKSLTAAVMISI